MTLAPPRPCAYPRCPQKVRGGGGSFCPAHARQKDRARGSAKARGYDQAWTAFSRAWLARFPWCGQRADGWLHADDSRCWQRGEMVRADVTDHVLALRDGGAHLDPQNSQSLCASCNAAKAWAARREGLA